MYVCVYILSKLLGLQGIIMHNDRHMYCTLMYTLKEMNR